MKSITQIFILFGLLIAGCSSSAVAVDGVYVFDVEHAKVELMKVAPENKNLPENIKKMMFEKMFAHLKTFTIELKGDQMFATMNGEKTVGKIKFVENTANGKKYLGVPEGANGNDMLNVHITINGGKLLFEPVKQMDPNNPMKALHFVRKQQ